MKFTSLSIFVLSCLFGSAAVADSAKTQGPLDHFIGGSIKKVLSGLELENLEGESIKLDHYLGKGPVVFDFWATWCKPCLAALPEINRLYLDLADQGLQVIGINEDGPRNASKVKPFVLANDFEFTVLFDLNRRAQRQLNALALPTTILLNSEGVVVHSSFGYRPGEIDELRKMIEELLAEKKESSEDHD